jgi:MFS transporter, DHA2 family, multidrug resistance protein
MLQAKQQAIAWISQQVQQQASLLAYVDALDADAGLARRHSARLLLRKVRLGGPAAMGH